MDNKEKIYKGAFVLMVAGLLSKVISAFYRIPLQNLTGDMGFYIYQQVYPILGIAFTLALYGFPIAISKYVTEHQSEKSNQGLYRKVFWLMALFSLFIFSFTYLFSPFFANWMGDHHLHKPLQHTAFVFLFIPFVALLRGWTQSYNWMAPTAYSQIIEQVVRAFIIIATAILIFQGYLSAYQIIDGAVLASIAALMASFVFLYVYKRKNATNHMYNGETSVTLRHLFAPIILVGIVISFNHMLLLLMQLADAFSLVPGLMQHGLSLKTAAITKGIFDRGQPLLQLVTIVGSSLAMAMVPQVTRINWQIKRLETLGKIRLTMKYCVLFSVGATVGLVVIFPEINELLYKNDTGTDVLRLLSISLLFTPLSITTASTLQGFGYTKWTAITLFIGLLLKIALNQLLVPYFGINGGAIATVVTVMFICISNLFMLRYVLDKVRLFTFSWLKIATASMIMIVSLMLLKGVKPFILLTDNRLYLCLFVLFSVFAGFLVYMYAIYNLKFLKNKEWNAMPIPSKWKKGR